MPQSCATNAPLVLVAAAQDLAEIWHAIPKPERFANSKLQDFFELSYTSLPHKLLEGERFVQEAAALSDRFNNPANPQYLWSQHYKGNVPADGLAHYARTIWEAIMTNKDLDLPSQREMLAMYRCDEISAEAYAAFTAAFTATVAPALAAKTIVEELGAQFTALLGTALASYRAGAEHYHPAVVERKREALTEQLLAQLKDAWNTNLALIAERAQQAFETQLTERFRQGRVVSLCSLSRSSAAHHKGGRRQRDAQLWRDCARPEAQRAGGLRQGCEPHGAHAARRPRRGLGPRSERGAAGGQDDGGRAARARAPAQAGGRARREESGIVPRRAHRGAGAGAPQHVEGGAQGAAPRAGRVSAMRGVRAAAAAAAHPLLW